MHRLLLACLLSFIAILPARAAEAPLAPGEHTFRSDDLQLWYRVSGKGPVMLFPTPGWGPSADYLFLSLQPLEDNFTVIYLDTCATGRSQVPRGDQITIDDFIGDLDNLRKHLGLERVWLGGHSMGGSMVLEYALRHPPQVSGVLSLAAAPSWLNPDKEREAAFQRARELQLETRRGRPGFEAQLAAWHSPDMPADDEAFKAGVMAVPMFTFWNPDKAESAREAFQQVRMSLRALVLTMQWSVDLTPEQLRQLRVPVLVVNGENDVHVPLGEALYLHRHLPNSKLLVVPDAAHFPWVEQPEFFFTQLREYLPVLGYPTE